MVHNSTPLPGGKPLQYSNHINGLSCLGCQWNLKGLVLSMVRQQEVEIKAGETNNKEGGHDGREGHAKRPDGNVSGYAYMFPTNCQPNC